MSNSSLPSNSASAPEDVQRGRQAAGVAAAALIPPSPNLVIGLGTGDTAAHFISALAERVHKGQLAGLRCVATSTRSAKLGQKLGLQIIELSELAFSANEPPIALTVDGADEIDPSLQLIKGAGGALLFEKLVAQASRQLVIVADPGKRVQRLGEKRLLPVEVVRFGVHHTLGRLRTVKGVQSAELRLTSEGPYLTDGGNQIIDVAIAATAFHAATLHAAIKALPGVIETGFFLHEATQVLIGHGDGQVEVFKRPAQ